MVTAGSGVRSIKFARPLAVSERHTLQVEFQPSVRQKTD